MGSAEHMLSSLSAYAPGLAIERHEELHILSGSAAGFFCVPCFLDLSHLTEYDGVAVEHIIPIAVERWQSDLDQARRGGQRYCLVMKMSSYGVPCCAE